MVFKISKFIKIPSQPKIELEKLRTLRILEIVMLSPPRALEHPRHLKDHLNHLGVLECLAWAFERLTWAFNEPLSATSCLSANPNTWVLSFAITHQRGFLIFYSCFSLRKLIFGRLVSHYEHPWMLKTFNLFSNLIKKRIKKWIFTSYENYMLLKKWSLQPIYEQKNDF